MPRKTKSSGLSILVVLLLVRLIYVLFNKIGSEFLTFSENSSIQSPLTQGLLQFSVGIAIVVFVLFVILLGIHAFRQDDSITTNEEWEPSKPSPQKPKEAFINTGHISNQSSIPHNSTTDIKEEQEYIKAEQEYLKKEISLSILKEIEWYSFELFCQKIYELCGYRVEKTSAGADGGVDLIVYKGSKDPHALVQCKVRTKQSIGVNYIRELRGVMAAQNVDKGILFSNTSFTMDAIEFAKNNSVELIDLELLYTKLRQLKDEDQGILYDYLHSIDYITPTCPNCETKLVVREAKRGKNQGQEFWGCCNYPKCRYKMPMKGSRWNN